MLATALAPHFGAVPGALHLRSDIERKKAAGYSEFVRLVPDAYSPAASVRVYSRLRELAAAALRAGRSVIVDATFLKEEERKEIERIVVRTGTRFHGLWLEAPLDVLRHRIRERKHDSSDATVEVVETRSTERSTRCSAGALKMSGERVSTLESIASSANTSRLTWDAGVPHSALGELTTGRS